MSCSIEECFVIARSGDGEEERIFFVRKLQFRGVSISTGLVIDNGPREDRVGHLVDVLIRIVDYDVKSLIYPPSASELKQVIDSLVS